MPSPPAADDGNGAAPTEATPTTLATAALAAYRLPPGMRPRPIARHFHNNQVFAVTADGDPAPAFALRLHRRNHRTPDQTRTELAVQRHLVTALAGTAVSVPEPVPTRDGDLVAVVGDRHCSLLTWVPGTALRPDTGLGPRRTRLLGEADFGAVLGNLADFPEQWPRLCRAFLDGYRSVRPLPPGLDEDEQWVRDHLAYRAEVARMCLAL